MKFKKLILFLVIILLITGCKKDKEYNVDVLDKAEDVIEDINFVQKSAAEESAYGLRKSVELYYTTLLLDGFYGQIIFYCSVDGCVSENDKLDLSGETPTSGKIIINDDGSFIFSDIIINSYNCDIPSKGNIICIK